MRGLLLAAMAMLAGPAEAAPLDWYHYTNDAYGYVLDVPPGFVSKPQTVSAGGLTFSAVTAEIIVWGDRLRARDFSAEAKAALEMAMSNGWALSSQTMTPSRATFEVRKGSIVMRAQMIAVCGGKGVAQYRMGYGRSDGPELQQALATMELGFRAEGGCSAL